MFPQIIAGSSGFWPKTAWKRLWEQNQGHRRRASLPPSWEKPPLGCTPSKRVAAHPRAHAATQWTLRCCNEQRGPRRCPGCGPSCSGLSETLREPARRGLSSDDESGPHPLSAERGLPHRAPLHRHAPRSTGDRAGAQVRSVARRASAHGTDGAARVHVQAV